MAAERVPSRSELPVLLVNVPTTTRSWSFMSARLLYLYAAKLMPNAATMAPAMTRRTVTRRTVRLDVRSAGNGRIWSVEAVCGEGRDDRTDRSVAGAKTGVTDSTKR